jgi:beta-lysine 5,6-aminomutase beta subunit
MVALTIAGKDEDDGTSTIRVAGVGAVNDGVAIGDTTRVLKGGITVTMIPVLCPYGDHLGDGFVQLSMTLPCSKPSAAKLLAEKMGFSKVEIVHKQPLTGEHTHYTIYGSCSHSLDPADLPEEPDPQYMDEVAIEEFAASLGRPIVVVGATTGTDTHTVGLDAILNLKGFDGHHGLEGYKCFEIHNLGSQVPNEQLVKEAIHHNADVVLVSQTVTQQNLHENNLKELPTLLHGVHDNHGSLGLTWKRRAQWPTVLICGGPRIGNEFARRLGYDAGFGKGTYPHHVATCIVRAMCERRIDLVHTNAAAETLTAGPEDSIHTY